MKKRNIKNSTDRSMSLNLALLLVFLALMIFGIFLVRDKLLYNADEMGTHLTESYSREEENRISIYQMFLNLGAMYADASVEEDGSLERLQDYLARYADFLEEVLGARIIDPYAVIDGKIVAATPWEGNEGYDYAAQAWYQSALEAEGRIVFTDVYTDAITGEKLVTLSRKLEGEGNVMAFDILMDKFHIHKNRTAMPKSSEYYLFDGKGDLIYVSGDARAEDAGVKDYADKLLKGVKAGAFESYTASVTDLEGNKAGVYYDEMENGWFSVITIPMEQILYGDMNTTMYILTGIFALLLVAVTAAMIRDYLGKRKVKHISDTLKILGDTYYAIYRINFETETYETIKSSSDVIDKLGKKGAYSHLLDTVGQVVESGTYEEFKKSFSMGNIRRLVKQRIYEFGGDYQRIFQDTRKWVSIRIVYNKGLGLNEVIMCFREIDMEKKKEITQHELLENALENARKADQKKTMFFSNMSHDMRTPLNAVTGLARLALENEQDPGKVHDYLEKIEASGKQLLALVNDVLEMSRIEQGAGTSLEARPVNLEECLEEAAGFFREQAKQEGKRFETKIRIQNAVVKGDPNRLKQILNNLLSNAFKYSEKGAKIVLEAEELEQKDNRGKYQIVVRDTGIGMSQSFLEKIFEPFARETMFAPVKASGTGLGMPIVKGLVQQMSGEIFVRSELGKGSEFTVLLPFQILQSEARKETREEEKLPAYSLLGKKILIAEDNELNMEIATEFLTMLGAELVQAWNGREALERFAASPIASIDAILMDMQMPEMDGCEASRKIRKLPRPDASSVPIIAVTANAFAEDIARTREAGMNAHISKPIDFKRLTEVLAKLSGKNQEEENKGEITT